MEGISVCKMTEISYDNLLSGPTASSHENLRFRKFGAFGMGIRN